MPDIYFAVEATMPGTAFIMRSGRMTSPSLALELARDMRAELEPTGHKVTLMIGTA